MNAVPRRRPGTAKSRRRRRRFWIGAALLILIAPGAIKPLCGAETNISPAAPWLVIEKVIVDGEPATTNALPPDGVITLSPGPHRMSFQFGPAAGGDAERPLRLRYRLEGTDEGWQEAGGAMRFTVRLTDTNNDPFAYQDFTATHDSAGWDGAPAKSISSYRREILTAPRRQKRNCSISVILKME
ncbi:MAG: hypothetical protein NTZ16_03355 [Verrucomicrobia bacterium]|nr:hypothetical protein [Verrucomicrobiota bacterium]